jgi:hypothetical protein
MRNLLLRISFVWLVLGSAIFAVQMALFQPYGYYKLASRAVQTRALVTAKEPQNHGLLHYSYQAGGKTFMGVGRAGYGNPDFESIAIGQELVAYYDPADPSHSVLGIPQAYVRTNVQVLIASILIFPAFVIYLAYRRVSSFRKWLVRN